MPENISLYLVGVSSTDVHNFAEFCTACAVILPAATDIRIRPLRRRERASAGARLVLL